MSFSVSPSRKTDSVGSVPTQTCSTMDPQATLLSICSTPTAGSKDWLVH